jgi:hypothetical protein
MIDKRLRSMGQLAIFSLGVRGDFLRHGLLRRRAFGRDPNNLPLTRINTGAFFLHHQPRLLGVEVMIEIGLEAIDAAFHFRHLHLEFFEALLLRHIVGQQLRQSGEGNDRKDKIDHEFCA